MELSSTTVLSKVKELQLQLGISGTGKSLVEDVSAIADTIGQREIVAGKPLCEQVEICYRVALGAPMEVAVGTIVQEARVQPAPVAEAQPAPVDLQLGTTPSHGNPKSTSALNSELNNVARNTNDTKRARSLVAAGADLSSTNGPSWRHTPLHQAAYHGRYEMAKVLVELGADTTLRSNPCGRGKLGTPLELARGGGHGAIVALLEGAPGAGEQRKASPRSTAAAASVQRVRVAGQGLWDRGQHPNVGPREDQNLPCITVCCAAPLILCPLHCMAAWGCANAVEALTSVGACKHLWCLPCSPNSKNPLWCCSEPLGWAASFGQLHTVMALVGNGADPYTLNASGNNAFTDAERERHGHVVAWLKAWESAGKPAKAPEKQRMRRGNAGGTCVGAYAHEGCYVGACIVPVLVTAFYVRAKDADTLNASGVTLVCPWSYDLRRAEGNRGPQHHKYELRAADQNQDWTWHPTGCCFYGTPGWVAFRVVPTSACNALC